MSDLNCYIATFNCGRNLVDVDYFASNFFNGLKTNLPPDLVVLSLEEIAPIGYSFLGGSFLVPYFVRLTTAIQVAASKSFETEVQYDSVVVRNVGMTALMVFAKSSIQERIRRIETAGVGIGLWEMGNKGAVAARIALEVDADDGREMDLTFVGAHLAPMEDAWEARNEDWKKICQGLVFSKRWSNKSSSTSTDFSDEEPLLSSSESGEQQHERGDGTLFSPTTHIFFSGDLNYRTSDTSPSLDEHEKWPQPVDSISDIRHYSHLLEHDQLNRERSKGKVFQHLTESQITFPPTYKYSEAAQKRAQQMSLKQQVNEDDAWLWAKHRTPSWCDRILYLQTAPPTVHSYAALPVQPTSDHRPVVLSLSIPMKALDNNQRVEPPFQIRKDWQEARAAARRYEYFVGIAAYLTLTWEGEMVVAGTLIGLIGGYVALRALIAP